MRPEERHCKRLFHGMMDQRELYDPDFDENRFMSDDVDNFKYDPGNPEDVKVLNWAFLGRVALIWQNRKEYFNGDAALIDLFDAYSNIVYQFHMVELYKPNLINVLGEDEYRNMGIDEMIDYLKSLYMEIIGCVTPEGVNMVDGLNGLTDELDEMSINMRNFGWTAGLPF